MFARHLVPRRVVTAYLELRELARNADPKERLDLMAILAVAETKLSPEERATYVKGTSHP